MKRTEDSPLGITVFTGWWRKRHRGIEKSREARPIMETQPQSARRACGVEIRGRVSFRKGQIIP